MRIYRPDIHAEALRLMSAIFHRLAAQVPPPRLINTPTGPQMRYQERLVEQALILKLARQQSGLNAMQILLDHGLIQEQAAIQRILDEISEDIAFLCGTRFLGQTTELHKKYLEAFWSEEFDHSDPLKSTPSRAPIPRKKIRSYVNRMFPTEDPSRADSIGRALYKAYSGFVHAASPHIMDMYGGSPPHFHIDGMLGTTILADYQHDSWNYFYRGLISIAYIAKFLNNEHNFHTIYNYVRDLEDKYYK